MRWGALVEGATRSRRCAPVRRGEAKEEDPWLRERRGVATPIVKWPWGGFARCEARVRPHRRESRPSEQLLMLSREATPGLTLLEQVRRA